MVKKNIDEYVRRFEKKPMITFQESSCDSILSEFGVNGLLLLWFFNVIFLTIQKKKMQCNRMICLTLFLIKRNPFSA